MLFVISSPRPVLLDKFVMQVLAAQTAILLLFKAMKLVATLATKGA